MDAETVKIAQQGITHAPTIGAMYEGLTRDILDRSLPDDLELRVVNGFIEGVDGRLSTQIDCMLVAGIGRKLPHIESFVWPVGDVVAVFEVKKNLFRRELNDAFAKQRAIREMANEHLRNPTNDRPVNIDAVFRSFMQITGIYISDYAEADNLGDDLHKFIFHFLVTELVSPVFVIFAFEGFADENSLRRGVLELLGETALPGEFYSPFKLPSLVVCRSNSILKLNGHPYIARINESWWHVLASNSENPLRLLIELIWTTLENRFGVTLPHDKNLKKERLAPLVQAQIWKLDDDKFAWIYDLVDIPHAMLMELQAKEWTPDEVSQDEAVVATLAYQRDSIDIRDRELEEYFKSKEKVVDVVNSLVDKRLLAREGEFITHPIHKHMYTIYNRDGRIYFSANTNLTGEWIMQEAGSNRVTGPVE